VTDLAMLRVGLCVGFFIGVAFTIGVTELFNNDCD